jgi:hypothetical protein
MGEFVLALDGLGGDNRARDAFAVLGAKACVASGWRKRINICRAISGLIGLPP